MRILLPTDLAPISAPAIEYAGELAARLGASVHVLHILDHLLAPTVAWATPAAAAVDLRARLYADARRAVHGVAAGLGASGLTVQEEVCAGNPAAEILRAACETHSDLIVMATHGRSGLARLVLGSTAEHVVKHSPCPVITLSEPVGSALAAGGEPYEARARRVSA